MNNRTNEGAGPRDVFHDGDDVVLAIGPYQGTPGTFVGLLADPNWAYIKERDGVVRHHPVEWLAHAHILPAIRLTGAVADQQS